MQAEHCAGRGLRLEGLFTVVKKTPRRVRPADVPAFMTAQRTGGEGLLQPRGHTKHVLRCPAMRARDYLS